MWQVKSMARPLRRRTLLAVVVLLPALVFGSACSSTPAPPPQPQTITDKGTPFGDCLLYTSPSPRDRS